jgi:hypothetical protein
MKPQQQTYRFNWQGIKVEAIYTPRKWGVIAHLEIRSIAPEGAPLPITSTGYRSHFHPIGTVKAHGGDVVAQVTAWLDRRRPSPNGAPMWLAASRVSYSESLEVRKAPVSGPHRARRLLKIFCTIPTQAIFVIFYQVISIDYTNPKIWSG